MAELETTSLPPLITEPSAEDDGWEDVDPAAPYGRKADGTPKAKPGRKAGSSGGSSSSRSVSRGSNDAKFAERISEELVELSAPLGLFSPMALLHVADRAEKTANALVIISKKHPAVKLAIESYFNSVAYKDLALFVLGIPVAVMIDMGVLKPDAVVGRIWDMQGKWDELYGENGSEFPDANGRVQARGLAGQL